MEPAPTYPTPPNRALRRLLVCTVASGASFAGAALLAARVTEWAWTVGPAAATSGLRLGGVFLAAIALLNLRAALTFATLTRGAGCLHRWTYAPADWKAIGEARLAGRRRSRARSRGAVLLVGGVMLGALGLFAVRTYEIRTLADVPMSLFVVAGAIVLVSLTAPEINRDRADEAPVAYLGRKALIYRGEVTGWGMFSAQLERATVDGGGRRVTLRLRHSGKTPRTELFTLPIPSGCAAEARAWVATIAPAADPTSVPKRR